MDGILEIWTQDRRIVAADETTVLCRSKMIFDYLKDICIIYLGHLPNDFSYFHLS